jgi:hypothetical protein
MLRRMNVSGWRSFALALMVGVVGGLLFAAFVLLIDELYP